MKKGDVMQGETKEKIAKKEKIIARDKWIHN